jgi:DNA mismatch repair protein MutS
MPARKQASDKDTPMMRQWREYRGRLTEDTLLLFRLGDFYELFHEDAEKASGVLGITLTQRQGYPMAGIPYHARDTYLPRLLQAGWKVALVDQVETPQAGKLVKRELTRILTPGTRLEEDQLEASHNHYLLALQRGRAGLHAAWLELSTGEFRIATGTHGADLLAVFEALDPQEILLPEGETEKWRADGADEEGHWLRDLLYFVGKRPVTELPDYHFELRAGRQSVIETLHVLNLDGFGIDADHPALGPAGALLAYAADNLCEHPRNVRSLAEYAPARSLLLDPATLVNLEIFRAARGGRSGSLLAAIDRTVTAAGARLLEQWLAAPSLAMEELTRRQECVQDFLEEPGIASQLHRRLKHTRDIPRILGRLQNRIRNPRELGGIRATLAELPGIVELLREHPGSRAQALGGAIPDFAALREGLEQALADELPGTLADGGVLRDGHDAELDRLRGLTRENKDWISSFERKEQAATGIRNLKVKYNGAFGYFIEVTRSNLSAVPIHYIRRQTMTNAERFTTDELKAREKEILQAEEKAIAREETLFGELLETVLEHADALRAAAGVLAELDLFCGWADLARDWDYCRPTLDNSDRLEIEQGRHPVVEQGLRADPESAGGTHGFVPNDTWLAGSEEQIALITGPNMAGKSTYIRQVALIVLLAQIGCWVPARACRLGLVDRIFSRVGASDELARGKSTFMVEMNETANILNNATGRSLVILDEVGRGTSTYDGLSIAWAVVEHLHALGDNGGAGPRTLFATHYHEITRLEDSLPRLRNYCVAVKEWNEEIIFVRQVLPGAADRSYGIQVARLAGLPRGVIERARTILESLEANGTSAAHTAREPESTLTSANKRRDKAAPPGPLEDEPRRGQLSLF